MAPGGGTPRTPQLVAPTPRRSSVAGKSRLVLMDIVELRDYGESAPSNPSGWRSARRQKNQMLFPEDFNLPQQPSAPSNLPPLASARSVDAPCNQSAAPRMRLRQAPAPIDTLHGPPRQNLHSLSRTRALDGAKTTTQAAPRRMMARGRGHPQTSRSWSPANGGPDAVPLPHGPATARAPRPPRSPTRSPLMSKAPSQKTPSPEAEGEESGSPRSPVGRTANEGQSSASCAIAASNGFLRFQDTTKMIYRGDRETIVEGMHEESMSMARHRREVTKEAIKSSRIQAREASERQLRKKTRKEALDASAPLSPEPAEEPKEPAGLRFKDKVRQLQEAIHLQRIDEYLSTGSTSPRKMKEAQFEPHSPARPKKGVQDMNDPDSRPNSHEDVIAPLVRNLSAPLSSTMDGRYSVIDNSLKYRSRSADFQQMREARRAAEAAVALQKSFLFKIKLASSQKSRMKLLRTLTKENLVAQRKTRIFKERQSQLNGLSQDMKIFLRKAFDTAAWETDRYEEESPRSTDEYAEDVSLDHRGVKMALTEFGLGGESTQEKTVIENLCSELTILGDVDFLTFACEAVPRVREEIQQLRRPALLQSFQFFDLDHSGHLDTNEVERIVEGLCLHNMTTDGRQQLRAAFEDIIDKNSKETGSARVTFDNFETLMEEMRERTMRIVAHDQAMIVHENNLSKEEIRLHSDELLSVYDVFKKALINLPSPGQHENAYDSNSLSVDQLRYIFMEFDIIPDSEEGWNHLVSQGWMLDMLTLFQGRLPFKRVLQALRNRREEIKLGRHFELNELLEQVDKDQSGTLNGQEVSKMLEMMGFSPKCREDQLRLKSLLHEVDADGSGCLDVYEFETLVMRLLTRLKDDARVRFHKASHELGLTEKEELQMQALFHTLAGASDRGTTVTDISAARHVADRLQSKVSSDDLRRIVAKCSSNGQELDLAGFTRVAVQLATSSDSKTALQKLFHVAEQRRLSMMEDAESRRKSMME